MFPLLARHPYYLPKPGTGYLLVSCSILLPVIYKWDLGSIDIYFLCPDDELSMTQYYYGNLSPSRRRKTRKIKDILRTKQAMIQVKFNFVQKKLKNMRNIYVARSEALR